MLALHQAVAENSIQQVQKLIDEGANVNELEFEIRPHGKCTPLQVAAYKGNEEIADLLISNGALLEAKNHKGETALSMATYQKKNNVVKLLLNKGAYSYLHHAVFVNNTEIVRTLLSYGANANELDDFHNTPLHSAIQMENCEIIQILLDHNADINASDHSGSTPLQDVILNKNVKVTQLLLERGADPNLSSNGYHLPLQIAVRSGCLKIVVLLKSYNVDLNHKDRSGRTALHFLHQESQSNQTVDMLEFLLRNGARINIQDNFGNNAIEKSLYCKNIGIAKLFWFNSF